MTDSEEAERAETRDLHRFTMKLTAMICFTIIVCVALAARCAATLPGSPR